jgi:hypothetical protein
VDSRNCRHVSAGSDLAWTKNKTMLQLLAPTVPLECDTLSELKATKNFPTGNAHDFFRCGIQEGHAF